ncbi:hypothetical protein [Algoriphagus confluentis]|uniref:Outer membrane protein beta-barrel domain-containing protein n=1 Tax=Algoriphagus confluentis TaxID=1697556 RepID=A0ABQ6PQ48_9BACT|nr:hypothetical protein Aconfl_19610 [Algoriphagus confluentis]
MKGYILPLFCLFFFSSSLAQIQTNASKKASRIVKSENYRSLSDDNGYYFFPHFGMRYGNVPDYLQTGIEDLSLIYGMGFGYRKENLSLESGLSVIHHSSSAIYFPIWERREYLMNSDLSFLVLPVTFRYDIPMGKKENLRIGAFINANWSMITLKDDDSRSGMIQVGENQGTYSITSSAKSPFFFMTGIHSRLRVFNSAFLNFEWGTFFSLGSNREYQVQYGDAPSSQFDRRWEGFSWSVGGILPLSVFEAKLRKKE